jgi:hypothetical protein
MRSVEERLLSALSRDGISHLRRLLEDCLAALERNHLGANPLNRANGRQSIFMSEKSATR